MSVENGKVIHTEPILSYSNADIERVVARGEAWVRRNYTSWPWKRALYYKISVDKNLVEFFFGWASEDI